MSVQLYDLYLQSKTIYINPALVTLAVSADCHRIPQIMLKNLQLWYTVLKTSHKRCETVREKQMKSIHLHNHQSLLLDQQAEKPSAVPWPPPMPARARTARYFPFISFGYHSHGNAWKLGASFFCFPACTIAPESCMHRIRLFAYVNHSAQNIPKLCVLVTDCSTHHAALPAQNSL